MLTFTTCADNQLGALILRTCILALCRSQRCELALVSACLHEASFRWQFFAPLCGRLTRWMCGHFIIQSSQKKKITVESQLSLQKVGGDCFSRFLCLPLVCAVSVLHILCFLAQIVQPVEKHTLGVRFCHIMFLFGL